MDLVFSHVPGPHVADYVVIGVFLSICMGIGVYYGYQTDEGRTLDNYFLGNRRLFMMPVCFSLFVTFQSAITLLGVPAEIYVYGIRGVYYGIATIIATVIGSFTFVPLLYPLQLTSTYEYLQLRFKSKSVRTLGTLLGMLQTIVYMGVTLYAPALALQTVAGIPLWLSIVVIGLIGTIYTAIGGIKGVIWTDVFQFIMIIIGLAAITIKGSIIIGEEYSIGRIAYKGNRLEFFNFDPDPRARHSMWGLIIGLSITYLPNWCNQSTLQRVSSVRSLTAAKRTLLMQVPVVLLYFGCLGYLGILLYAYYHVLGCDPVESNSILNVNQLMPFFVLDIFRSLPGLSGIYISCLFSGSLSTLSSGINSLAANTVEDIFGNKIKKLKISSQTFAAKVFVFFYGLVIVGLAYGINYMSGSMTQIALQIFGTVGSPLAGLFFLGGLVVRANWIGAMVGSISALVFNIWIVVGTQLYGRKPLRLQPNPTDECYGINATIINYTMPSLNDSFIKITDAIPFETTMQTTSNPSPVSDFFLYNLSYTWYGFTGFFLTLAIGTLVSYCTVCDEGEQVDARFIFPFCRKLCRLETRHTYNEVMMADMGMQPVKNIGMEQS